MSKVLTTGLHVLLTAMAVPLNEESARYEVDVMNGATVVRTIATTTPTASYSAAQQIADFGSAQSAISVRVYQLSASVGRGWPGAAILLSAQSRTENRFPLFLRLLVKDQHNADATPRPAHACARAGPVAKTDSGCEVRRRARGRRQDDPSARNRRRLTGPAVTNIWR
jgi:hypothetical protein